MRERHEAHDSVICGDASCVVGGGMEAVVSVTGGGSKPRVAGMASGARLSVRGPWRDRCVWRRAGMGGGRQCVRAGVAPAWGCLRMRGPETPPTPRAEDWM